ncbi:MAG: SRPBCC domain-containing protein [Thermoplasmata archaeon]|nr:SRPBCC domain-containing protein [Thermoplasmata archaeon]
MKDKGYLGRQVRPSVDPIVIDLEFVTPVEDLWAAFTDPTQINRWLARASKVALEEGGSVELDGFPGTAEAHGSAGGTIRSLEEEYSLRIDWHGPQLAPGSPADPPASTTLFVRFQPLGPARARLHLEHLGWGDGAPWESSRAWYSQQWTEALARLKPLLEA